MCMCLCVGLFFCSCFFLLALPSAFMVILLYFFERNEQDISLATIMNSCAQKLLNSSNSDTTRKSGSTSNNSDPVVFQPTCDLYDTYLDDARVPCISFQSFGKRKQFCGRAVTIKCFEDNSRVKELMASTNSGKGKVLVVDGGGSQRVALLGDMVAKDAVRNGWEGLVLNGNVRDVEELRKLDIGVLALGCTPRKSVRRDEGSIDLPVQIGNVWVRPGDAVFADEDGVLIVE